MTRPARTWLVAGATAAIVAAANASDGAYFSQSWGWVALAFFVPTTVVLILGVTRTPGVLRAAFAMLFGLLAVWVALSAIWSVSSAASAREVERMLVYMAVALALALLLRRGDASGVLGGAFAGIVGVTGYGLATRLFPERFDTFDDPTLPYRLSEPIGYWNAFGLLASMGILLAFGAAAHARSLWQRLAGATALPMLAAALYFSFSRGAWVALGVGYVAAIVLDPRRIRLLWTTLVIVPPAVALVAFASTQDALTTEDAPLHAAVAEGERVASWLVAAAIAAALLALLASFIARRVVPPPRTRRLFDVALGLAGVAAITIGLVVVGGPRATFDELKDRFDAELVVSRPGALNERLFNLSGNGRSNLLSLSWEMASERPLVGYGAGSFEYLWYERRDIPLDVRDAHSLYGEMLAELGFVGFALLLSALTVVLLAIVRGRRHPLVASAGAVFVAWAAHSAVDWDWEVVGVTTTALLVGGAGLMANERGVRALLADRWRLPLAGLAAGLSAAAIVSLVGNQALFAARDATRRGEYASAVDHAKRAERLLPWSHEPLVASGDAAIGLGHRRATVRAYREALRINPRSWSTWLRLAQVTAGNERTRAYTRVRQLNPLEDRLPGEDRTSASSP